MSIQNLRNLIDQLEDLAAEFGDDAEVRLAQQPRWAFEYSLGEIAGVQARPASGRREATPACIYLAEGSQLGYLPTRAATALDWPGGGEQDEEDDEDPEPLAEDYPGQRITGPDFDTRDREGAAESCPGCGCLPGDGVTSGCTHPDGCGAFAAEPDSISDYTDPADRQGGR
jgi:hypothetical protein